MLAGCLMGDPYWQPYGGPPPSWDSAVFNGTGIIVGDGLVLTAAHVVQDCKVIRIAAASDAFRALPATTKAVGPKHDAVQLDVALLAAGPAGAPAWPAVSFIDSWPGDAKLRALPKGAGDEVGLSDLRLLGYPVQTTAPHPATSPVFHLGAARPDDVLQFHLWAFVGNAAPGFSGGPLVDPSGAVLGIAFRGIQAHDPQLSDAAFPDGVQLSNGLGMAVSSKELASFLAQNGVQVSSAAPARPIEDSLVQVFCFR